MGKIDVFGRGAFPRNFNGRAGVPNAGEDEGIGSAILKRSGCRGVEASMFCDFNTSDRVNSGEEMKDKLSLKKKVNSMFEVLFWVQPNGGREKIAEIN